jgi:hypothetical protein
VKGRKLPSIFRYAQQVTFLVPSTALYYRQLDFERPVNAEGGNKVWGYTPMLGVGVS